MLDNIYIYINLCVTNKQRIVIPFQIVRTTERERAMDDDYWNSSSVTKKVNQQGIFDKDGGNTLDVSASVTHGVFFSLPFDLPTLL